MHYKAPDNTIHVIDSEQFEYMLPAGSVPITDEEAEALKPVPAPPTVAEQLAALDAANTLTQRNLRDFILLTTEALKLGQPVDLSSIRGVARVAEIEAQAAELRALL